MPQRLPRSAYNTVSQATNANVAACYKMIQRWYTCMIQRCKLYQVHYRRSIGAHDSNNRRRHSVVRYLQYRRVNLKV